MSLSAAVVRELIAAGLSGAALADACERIEAAAPAAPIIKAVDEQAERRREVDRRRKQSGWSLLRVTVFERDGYECVYCGDDVRSDPQCDHIFPISRGGRNDLSNLATACRPCNSSKGDKTPEEWRS